MRTTHTFVKLELSESAYDEIKTKLEAAGYQHAFVENDDAPASPLIDMHGIAVCPEVEMVGHDVEQAT